MDAEILATVITGVFGAIVTPLVKDVLVPLLRHRRINRESLKTFLLAIVGGAIGVILGYFVVRPFFTPCSPLATTYVEISAPATGSTVPRLVIVEGKTCNLKKGEELWLFIQPAGTASFYPQHGPIEITDNGKWTSSIYIGLDDPTDTGRGFLIVAVLADASGSEAIRVYFTQSGSSYIGLEPLPPGVRIASYVQVVRK
jgi:uncharacterized membrane protein YeaQ/YmgE (transglycosylase-associated protein family)